MGAKQSTNNGRTTSTRNGSSAGQQSGAGTSVLSAPVSSRSIRTRSLNNVEGAHFSLPGQSSSYQESDISSSPDESPRGHMQGFHSQSLPAHIFATSFIQGVKCPVCSKYVQTDDIELHLVICLTKPRISYNEDTVKVDSGECVICFEDLRQGDRIARLPCLCIYHKQCIDQWFEVNRSCPEHPS